MQSTEKNKSASKSHSRFYSDCKDYYKRQKPRQIGRCPLKEICPEVITVVLSPYYRLSVNGSVESIDRFVAQDDGPDALISEINDLFGGVSEQSPGCA